MHTASQLVEQLRALKARKREGEIDMRAYYQQLLELLDHVVHSLVGEVDSLTDEEIILQTPLLLLFLEEQVAKFDERES
ncbi:MAG: hypothetical protein Q9O62_01755 [Ardenticatenia bacterium]|nr:hypothetical protein [Ardenticatenia bacterium]